MLNAVTIDLEDWYQGIEQPFATWGRFTDRLHVGMDVLLNILDQTGTRATFFVLGWIAEKHPALIHRLAEQGHEIASHGYDHEKLYHTTPDALRETLLRAKRATEDASGAVVLGYRAPFFSLTRASLWALDVLSELGFTYDCSVYPGSNWRYGIPGTPEHIYRVEGTSLTEFPVSTLTFSGRKLGIGGAYFRILPYHVTHNGVRALNTVGKAAMFYLHPWEFDPGHPLVRFRWRAMLTHYFNLSATAPRFARLLRDFRFGTVSAVFNAQETPLPMYSLSESAPA
jgi:polysaccharide deacetylase family protein (PEP-CTERM system associated)